MRQPTTATGFLNFKSREGCKMKSKVLIENGETTIVLEPENTFEKRVIEDVANNKENHNIHTGIATDQRYGVHTNHKILLTIQEIRP